MGFVTPCQVKAAEKIIFTDFCWLNDKDFYRQLHTFSFYHSTYWSMRDIQLIYNVLGDKYVPGNSSWDQIKSFTAASFTGVVQLLGNRNLSVSSLFRALDIFLPTNGLKFCSISFLNFLSIFYKGCTPFYNNVQWLLYRHSRKPWFRRLVLLNCVAFSLQNFLEHLPTKDIENCNVTTSKSNWK